MGICLSLSYFVKLAFLLQTAILNDLMACIARKIISGIKKDVGMELLV